MLKQSRGKKEMFHSVKVIIANLGSIQTYFSCGASGRRENIFSVSIRLNELIALNRDISTDASSYYSPKSKFKKQYIYLHRRKHLEGDSVDGDDAKISISLPFLH